MALMQMTSALSRNPFGVAGMAASVQLHQPARSLAFSRCHVALGISAQAGLQPAARSAPGCRLLSVTARASARHDSLAHVCTRLTGGDALCLQQHPDYAFGLMKGNSVWYCALASCGTLYRRIEPCPAVNSVRNITAAGAGSTGHPGCCVSMLTRQRAACTRVAENGCHL